MRYALLLLVILSTPSWANQPIRVAVASNFKPTLEKINATFEQESGREVRLSSASTGVLYSQITHGAPYDLFFSADRETAERLVREREGSSAFCYALGRLALAGGGLDKLGDARQSVAIANPATAPYGRAAVQVLARPSFRSGQKRKLVRANNVAQAYQYWHSHAVELAIIPLSLAPESAPRIPAQWHDSLEQYAVILQAGTTLGTYLKWIRSDTVRELIIEAGYEPCP